MKGLIYTIEEKFQSLTTQNKKIASFILKNHHDVIWMSAKELAEKVDVSQATITRFCKVFKFEGYAQLRIVLSQELERYNRSLFNNLETEDFKQNIASNLLNRNISSFTDTYAMLDKHDIMTAAGLINQSNKILCAGIGASGLVAQDMVQKLLRIQKNAFMQYDNDLQKIAISQFGPEDLLFAVSYSGKKSEIIELASLAVKHNVPVIALTRVGETELSKMATINFEAAAFEGEYRTSATSSRLVHLYIVDILFYSYGLLYQENSFEKLRQTYDVLKTRNKY